MRPNAHTAAPQLPDTAWQDAAPRRGDADPPLPSPSPSPPQGSRTLAGDRIRSQDLILGAGALPAPRRGQAKAAAAAVVDAAFVGAHCGDREGQQKGVQHSGGRWLSSPGTPPRGLHGRNVAAEPNSGALGDSRGPKQPTKPGGRGEKGDRKGGGWKAERPGCNQEADSSPIAPCLAALLLPRPPHDPPTPWGPAALSTLLLLSVVHPDLEDGRALVAQQADGLGALVQAVDAAAAVLGPEEEAAVVAQPEGVVQLRALIDDLQGWEERRAMRGGRNAGEEGGTGGWDEDGRKASGPEPTGTKPTFRSVPLR